MPLAEQLAAAITSAPNFAALDDIARLTWRSLGEGYIDDAAADALGTRLEARRAVFRGDSGQPRRRAPAPASARSTPAQRPPRSPDRKRSIERRRRQATSGILPAPLACRFTLGQVAVLAVVGRQTKATGSCALPIDAIAAMAGVSRTLVKDALREAVRLGLVRVDERPRPGRRNDTNVVTITSAEWRAWLKIGSTGIGVRKATTTGYAIKKQDLSGRKQSQQDMAFTVRSVLCLSGGATREENIANGTGEQHD